MVARRNHVISTIPEKSPLYIPYTMSFCNCCRLPNPNIVLYRSCVSCSRSHALVSPLWYPRTTIFSVYRVHSSPEGSSWNFLWALFFIHWRHVQSILVPSSLFFQPWFILPLFSCEFLGSEFSLPSGYSFSSSSSSSSSSYSIINFSCENCLININTIWNFLIKSFLPNQLVAAQLHYEVGGPVSTLNIN